MKGRNKIQDKWDLTPHIVVGKVAEEGSAYLVQKYDADGPLRAINRVDLLEYVFSDPEDEDQRKHEYERYDEHTDNTIIL